MIFLITVISLTAKYLFCVCLVSILNNYRSTYDNLKRSYQLFGQFQYSYQGDQGEIKTKVKEYVGSVEIESTIKGIGISFIRSITVYKEGEIVEEEWSSYSKFKRIRVIFESGLWEEYRIGDRINGFGFRKVVYPDGQQFTNEVYDYYDRWNEVDDETYEKLEKSIFYILGNNIMNQYKFVKEDGFSNIADLGKNDNKLILISYLRESSSNSRELSDSDWY